MYMVQFLYDELFQKNWEVCILPACEVGK